MAAVAVAVVVAAAAEHCVLVCTVLYTVLPYTKLQHHSLITTPLLQVLSVQSGWYKLHNHVCVTIFTRVLKKKILIVCCVWGRAQTNAHDTGQNWLICKT